MADDKKSNNLVDKIGLFIDKTLTFGGGLQFDQSDINNAVKQLMQKLITKLIVIKILKLKMILTNLKKF